MTSSIWWRRFWAISGWVVGIALTLWIFLAERDVKELAYSVPGASRIYDDARTSNIRVTDPAGTPIEGDVFLQEVLVWNSGNVELEPEDVRLPIVIKPIQPADFERGDFIDVLEARIVAQASLVTSRASIRQSGTRADLDRRIEVRWEHLDEPDAFKVQIIYSTTTARSVGFELVGQIEGVNQFIEVPDELQTSLNSIRWSLYTLGVFIIVVILLAVLAFVTKRVVVWPLWVVSILSLLFTVYSLSGLNFLVISGRTIPSF